MNIEFKKFSEFQRGLMVALLKDAYSFETGYERDWLKEWIEADNFFITIWILRITAASLQY